jgi:type IV pilus assembly protein PilA
MNNSFQSQLLQHFAKKKSNAGFTLIELLVVIIIVGILSAIALPTFLDQAGKARESEAKTNLGALNRGQQAYRLENGEFASSISDLDVGIQDDIYSYSLGNKNSGSDVTHFANPSSNSNDVRKFCGGVNKDGKTKIVPDKDENDDDCASNIL